MIQETKQHHQRSALANVIAEIASRVLFVILTWCLEAMSLEKHTVIGSGDRSCNTLNVLFSYLSVLGLTLCRRDYNQALR